MNKRFLIIKQKYSQHFNRASNERSLGSMDEPVKRNLQMMNYSSEINTNSEVSFIS